MTIALAECTGTLRWVSIGLVNELILVQFYVNIWREWPTVTKHIEDLLRKMTMQLFELHDLQTKL